MQKVLEPAPDTSVATDLATSQQNARAAGYAHRVAIAQRFAKRIAAADAVFATGKAVSMQMPYTVHGDAKRPVTGFNRWMLLQVMQDQAWTDPRFFTQQQLDTAGWRLHSGAQPVVLQFVSSTNGRGEVLSVPDVKRFAVYNAVFIDGLPSPGRATKLPSSALETAMVAADFEPGTQIVEALADWVNHSYEDFGGREGAVQKSLAQALAMNAVFAEIEWSPAQLSQVERYATLWRDKGWTQKAQALIEADSSEFFDAVRVAELAAAHVMTLTRIAQQEVHAIQEIQAAQKEASMEITSSNSSTAAKGGSTYKERLEEMFAAREAVLAVPYKEKDQAYARGAVFYPPSRVWFVPAGEDVKKFKEWDPRQHCLGPTATDAVLIESFITAMQSLNLEEPRELKADGQWHNVRVTDKKGRNLSGAYILDLKSGTGYINNKYSGEKMSWVYDGPLLTPEQRAQLRAEAEARAKIADAARQKTQDTAAVHAAEIVALGVPAHGHGYVQKKGITAEGLVQVPGKVLLRYEEFYGESGYSAIREDQDYLIVPMCNAAGQIRAVQAISEDGAVKSFMRGGQKRGTMAVLGADSFDALCAQVAAMPNRTGVASFVEGFATGASKRAATTTPVIVCFDAGNLEVVVAENASKIPPNMLSILAVDNDQYHVERALGFLSHELGVNPNSQRGSTVEVLSGSATSRLVSMGDALADGEWHQAAKGRYRMEIIREDNSTECRSIVVEALIDGEERTRRMTFNNRGLEAGRTALQTLAQREPGHMNATMLVPEFKSLQSRPTDWNDMARIHGSAELSRQFFGHLKQLGLFTPPEQQGQQRAGVERSHSRVER